MSKRLMMTGAAALLTLTATAAPAAAIDVPERSTAPAIVEQGPPNYPAYDPQYELAPISTSGSGDATSAVLGAIAGFALAGAAFGTAFAVAARRDRPQRPQAA
ncbi:hypothetical protein ACIBL3_13100 [Kribbella sp. NPDC050124]|uniref:hypothetical protein n=1 Tax=Kribbella sp. NPDC050124 TaxID=3364114 RepID=UPI0037BB805D